MSVPLRFPWDTANGSIDSWLRSLAAENSISPAESGLENGSAEKHVSLRLAIALLGNGLQRIAAGTSAVLIGLYLADLANHGHPIGAGIVGLLGAVSFGAELLAAAPMGVASDAVAPCLLMAGGSLLGAVASQLFGMSGLTSIFFLSRALEGLGSCGRNASAAGAPHGDYRAQC